MVGFTCFRKAAMMLNSPTQWYDAYVFDLDGTIYLGDHLLPAAKRLIEELRANDRIVRFLSNNPTKDPQQYQDKLERLGIPVRLEDIANTVVTTTQWLLKQPLARAMTMEYAVTGSWDDPRIDPIDASGKEPDKQTPRPANSSRRRMPEFIEH